MSQEARGDVREPFVQPCILARLLASSLKPIIVFRTSSARRDVATYMSARHFTAWAGFVIPSSTQRFYEKHIRLE
jgi:hypothetical protein